jgi:hypothetical protein
MTKVLQIFQKKHSRRGAWKRALFVRFAIFNNNGNSSKRGLEERVFQKQNLTKTNAICKKPGSAPQSVLEPKWHLPVRQRERVNELAQQIRE